MGICTRRHFLLTICILQLISTVERQVFDFLGYMWAPILANFFNIIFVIFGFFGAFQYRPKYIITYTVWCILWLGWNIFVICFYLSVGALNKDSDILNLGTGSVSWWEVNGAGCKPVYPTNLTVAEDPDPFRPLRPERVVGCFLSYEYVEVLHAALQCLLAVLGSMGGVSVSHVFLEEDDSFDFLDGFEAKSPQHLALRPMYVRSYTPVPSQHASYRSPLSSPSKLTCSTNNKVKALRLQAQVNKYGGKRNGSGGNQMSLYSIEFSPRDSTRGNGNDSVEYEDDQDTHLPAPQLSPRPMTPRRVKRRSVISRGSTARSSLPNVHDKRSSIRYNNVRSSLRASSRRTKLQHHHQSPVTRLIEQQQQQQQQQQCLADSSTSNDSTRLNLFEPCSSSQADLLTSSTPQWKKTSQPLTGHTNPLYQQSSLQSLNNEDEDMYNNRPPSARSSYSNYHGTRPISCYVGPGGTPAYYIAGQATAQVPVTNTHRRSNHAIARTRPPPSFINSGPPAYNVQGVVDSETVI